MLTVTQKLMQFCSIELGSFYLDIIKDRQYTAKTDGHARRSCQTALYHIVEALVRWIAPVLSFTAQEVWEVMPGKRQQYVFADQWYDNLPATAVSFDNDFWQQVLEVRNVVNTALEQARKSKIIGGSLESSVTVYVKDDLNRLLTKLEDELRFVLITSSAVLAHWDDCPNTAFVDEEASVGVVVSKAPGHKCVRCWHFCESVHTHAKHDELCNRCIDNVDGVGENRAYA